MVESRLSRPATDSLKDLLRSLVNLETLPDGEQLGEYWSHYIKRLYLENGWPENFDYPEFVAAVKAFDCQQSDEQRLKLAFT